MVVKDQLIGVVGLQRTGVATVKALLHRGARVLATDAKPLDELPADFKELAASRAGSLDLQLSLGDATHAGLERCDLVVISPGVPPSIEPLQRARARGGEVIGEIELAYRLGCRAPIIAVTGTKGKTTTTTLIGEMLKAAGVPTVVAGNIGNALIAELDHLTPQHRVVLEVSSFQLETTVHFRPHVAVFLNLHDDHLDRHASFDEYRAAKMKIFANQTSEDYAVLNADQPLVEVSAIRSLQRFFSMNERADAFLREGVLCLDCDGDMELLHRDEVRMLGAHNIANLLAACLAVRLTPCPPSLTESAMTRGQGGHERNLVDVVRRIAREFPGVQHRLELVAEINGVKFVNDSQGTTVAATIAGLEAFEVPVVLIAGGLAKVADFAPLGKAIAQRAHALVLIGRDANRIEAAASAHGFRNIHHAATLPEAVKLSAKLCPSPGIVLLSPACASFDMFKNYEERGKVFREAALALG